MFSLFKCKKKETDYWWQELCVYCSAPIRVRRGERECPLRCQNIESNEDFFRRLRSLFKKVEMDEFRRVMNVK